MVNERLEDIQSFSRTERTMIYGEHFLERLKDVYPEMNLVGRVIQGDINDGDGFGPIRDFSTFYVIGEEVTREHKFFGVSLWDYDTLKVVVEIHNEGHGSSNQAQVRDPQFREDTQRILAELDAESGERYSDDIHYSTKELLVSPDTKALLYG